MEHKTKPPLLLMSVMLFLLCIVPVANALTAQGIFTIASDATVHLAEISADGEINPIGSGFFVRPNHIATNFHVIEGITASKLRAILVDQKKLYLIERIRAVDEKHDLAILKVIAPGVQPLRLGDSNEVEIGDEVYVVGNPLGPSGTIAPGQISKICEQVQGGEGKIIQYTASTSKGSSGGPALNNNGEVIGVHVAGLKKNPSGEIGQNINFAIPSVYLKNLVIRQLGQVRPPTPNSTPRISKSQNSVQPKPTTPKPAPQEIAKKTLDATVHLFVVGANGKASTSGSGFFVQPNLIATNFHVIDGFARVEAKLVGQNMVFPVEHISVVDKKHDLAILQVSAFGIEPLVLGDSEAVAIGENIYVTGNPLGAFEGTFSDGLISTIREIDGAKLFQVTSPISEGNSGGPVLNTRGEVIGVLKGTIPAGQNLNFAIPSIYLKVLIDSLGNETPGMPKASPSKPQPSPIAQEMLEKDDEIAAPNFVQRALAASVSLELLDSNGAILGRGSGFFVRRNLIATNFHVIDGASGATVKVVNKEPKYRIIGVTATDEKNDLALLKVAIHGITPLPLGNSNMVQIGEDVYVVGNPKDFEGTVSNGIISGRREKGGEERLQMTAPISPGSSGGPVLNLKGEVIGVSVSLYNPLFAQNINFAIPSNALKALIARSGRAKPLSRY